MKLLASSALQIRVASDYKAMGEEAAKFLLAEIKQKPNLLLCASAGGTPNHTYESLARAYARQPRMFGKLKVIQIDEWGGLPRRSPASCEADLRLKLLSPLHIDADRFVRFRSDATEPEVECRRVTKWLAVNGPIDICILGLGLNGHVAMNEPASAANPRAHVAKLARSSRRHGMLRELARKPTYGLTLGLGEILQSKRILLLVSGKKKQTALRRLMIPKVTSRFPASFLWLHPNAIVVCDRTAADGL
jgi:putative deaminase/isomerase